MFHSYRYFSWSQITGSILCPSTVHDNQQQWQRWNFTFVCFPESWLALLSPLINHNGAFISKKSLLSSETNDTICIYCIERYSIICTNVVVNVVFQPFQAVRLKYALKFGWNPAEFFGILFVGLVHFVQCCHALTSGNIHITVIKQRYLPHIPCTDSTLGHYWLTVRPNGMQLARQVWK